MGEFAFEMIFLTPNSISHFFFFCIRSLRVCFVFCQGPERFWHEEQTIQLYHCSWETATEVGRRWVGPQMPTLPLPPKWSAEMKAKQQQQSPRKQQIK